MTEITVETRNDSYEKVDSASLHKKIRQIFEEKGTGLTAHQVAQIMYARKLVAYPHRQAVAPRLTEMEIDGVLAVHSKEYDSDTKRYVAVYSLV